MENKPWRPWLFGIGVAIGGAFMTWAIINDAATPLAWFFYIVPGLLIYYDWFVKGEEK